MSVIIDTTISEVESVIKYARYGANNCMIGNGWEIRELVRCKDCKHRPIKPDNYNSITTDGFALEFPDEKCPCQCSDGWYSKYPDDDWFCPNGERRSE